MGKKTRTLLNCILLAALVLGLVMTGRQLLDKSAAGESYDEALRIAGIPEETPPPETDPAETLSEETAPPETVPEPRSEWIPAPVTGDAEAEKLASLDLNALREKNPDVIGWIRIPGTRVDYPLVQGADNEYYLNHTWQKNRNSAGSIFLEQTCEGDFSGFHTLLYGHNMANGSMFAGIVKYQRTGYFRDHPYVYIVTDAGMGRYEVFSGYRTEVGSVAYSLDMQERETREYFLSVLTESDELDTGITPDVTDRILTLSTCYGSAGNRRWVLHARQVMTEVPQ